MKITTLCIWLVLAAIFIWFLSHVHILAPEPVAATNEVRAAPAKPPPITLKKAQFKKPRGVGKSGGANRTHRGLDGLPIQ